MLIDQTLVEFLDATASSEPVPGGGSIAAQSGATAAALIEMVAKLTIAKKTYEDVSDEMKEIAKKAARLRSELVKAIDYDADAYNSVMLAYQLPKETEVQKETRKAQIQVSMRLAATVPLGVARKAHEILYLSKDIVMKCNKNAVTDGLVAAMMARTSILSAIYNVKINLASISDLDYTSGITKEIDELTEKATLLEKEIMGLVCL